jgi:hypothetical protein
MGFKIKSLVIYMALKPWLIRKIEKNEQELKYLNALLIMLTHVENAIVESESESDTDMTDSDNSLKIGKIIPGVNVTICNKKKYANTELDCIIVLAWNFFNEIKNKNQDLSTKFMSIQDLEEINSVK